MDIIKIGGAQGLSFEPLLDELADRHANGRAQLLVHGGSDATNRLCRALQVPVRFLESPTGQLSRDTTREVLEVFVQATAWINRRLVEGLQARGVSALGLSGIDGGLLQAQRKAVVRAVDQGRQFLVRDQWTGRPEAVNTELIRSLCAQGMLLVVAPIGLSPEGEMLNLDGDRAAACLARELGARRLIILSNVPGLLRRLEDPSSLVERVPFEQLETAMALARGRMRKKLLAAREALEGGVGEVLLGDGRVRSPLQQALNGGGTSLENREAAIHSGATP